MHVHVVFVEITPSVHNILLEDKIGQTCLNDHKCMGICSYRIVLGTEVCADPEGGECRG